MSNAFTSLVIIICIIVTDMRGTAQELYKLLVTAMLC